MPTGNCRYPVGWQPGSGCSRGAALLVLGVLVAMACEAKPEVAGATSVLRDSAGIRITEKPAAVAEEWTLSDSPILELGSAVGSDSYLFDNVRDAVRLSHGGLAVADGSSREIRFFDASGRQLVSVGGEGEGPGEFMALSRLVLLPADTVVAWDPSARRVSFLTGEGQFVRYLSLEVRSSMRPELHGFFEDGSFVVSAGLSSIEELASEEGIRRMSLAYLRFGPQGRLLDTLLVAPGRERLVRMSGESLMLINLFFGRQTFAATDGNLLHVGDNDRYELRHYDRQGNLVGLIRRSHEPAVVTDDDLWAAWREQLRYYPSGLRERTEEGLRTRGVGNSPHRETLPAFSALQATGSGHVWVRDSVVPGSPERWSQFDPDGGLRVTLVMPERFQALSFGSDYVIGVKRDDLDVEHVLLYRLGPDGEGRK